MAATPVTFGYTFLSAVVANHSLAEAFAASARALGAVLAGQNLTDALSDLKR